MKKLLTLALATTLSFVAIAQENISRSFSYHGKDVFIKAEPNAKYDLVDDFKCPTGEDYRGAGGLRKILGGIDKAIEKERKGKVNAFNAIICAKPGKITLIDLERQETTTGQLCTVVAEKKSQKLVFVCNYPTTPFDVVENVKFTEGGIGTTYRGGNSLEIMVNGFLDKASRQEKKGKILAFDAIYIDTKHLQSGFFGLTSNAVLIKFK